MEWEHNEKLDNCKVRLVDVAEWYASELGKYADIESDYLTLQMDGLDTTEADRMLKESDNVMDQLLALVAVKNVEEDYFFGIVNKLQMFREQMNTRLVIDKVTGVGKWTEEVLRKEIEKRVECGLSLRSIQLARVDGGLNMRLYRSLKGKSKVIEDVIGMSEADYEQKIRGGEVYKSKRPKLKRVKVYTTTEKYEDGLAWLLTRKGLGESNEFYELRKHKKYLFEKHIQNKDNYKAIMSKIYREYEVENYLKLK